MKLAIYDIDKTLYNGYSTVEFIEYLHKKRLFRQENYNNIMQLLEGLKTGETSYFRTAHQYVMETAEGLVGQDKDKINVFAKEFFDRSRLFSFSEDLVRIMKKYHYYNLILSNSLIEVLSPIKDYLRMDGLLGIELETSQGKYTGNINSEMHFESGKKGTLAKFLKSNRFTLDMSFGFGDSEHDIAFLEDVKNPVVISPRDELKIHAEKYNWTVAGPNDVLKKVEMILRSLE
ncbi:MAG: haloacid dehalogenase-like hydrolase [Nanoarchaeota archaeon]|nr:haloacid dehalogenase-like hydrolase [Nanoarchaeota archaeon]